MRLYQYGVTYCSIARLRVTFVDAINVEKDVKNNKWYFLQMIVFCFN